MTSTSPVSFFMGQQFTDHHQTSYSYSQKEVVLRVMENLGQSLQPEEVRAQAMPNQPLPESIRNGPVRDYRAIHREPGHARRIRHGNEALYCVPMTKFMLILSILLTGAILLVLFVLLLTSEFSGRIEKEFIPRTTDIPKYY